MADASLCGAHLRLRLLLLPTPSALVPGEILRLQLQLVTFAVSVQLNHVSFPGVVEAGRRPWSTVEFLAARASDHHVLAEVGALGADFLLELVQVGDSAGRRQCVQPPGLLV